MNKRSMKSNYGMFRRGGLMTMGLACLSLLTTAQDTDKKKTIDITSSFKPSLLNQQKIGFTASAAGGDTARPSLNYQLPTQNLVLRFAPSPLRPLAFQQEEANLPTDPSVFLKLGYGNFSSPLVQALASFGDGKKMNGNVEAGYRASKGKIDFQEWQQYGAKGNLWLHMKNNSALHFSGGYTGTGTYRYGFAPKTVPVGGDSLRVRYNLAELGAALANPVAGPAGITYDARLKGHFFSDNAQGQETALQFDMPLTKKISDQASFGLGIKGMVSSFSGADTSFSNNLFTIPVGATVKLKENMLLRAGIIPSWNNADFRLLPDIDFEYLLKDNNMVVQAGFKGYFDEQTFRGLATTNPWIRQPNSITNTQNT
ncbi:MAG: hypothetical protein MUF29_11105 [Chitinophagaceae bacterium]|nr:hypothetical protein [Chitinophagaceae bacterium]